MESWLAFSPEPISPMIEIMTNENMPNDITTSTRENPREEKPVSRFVLSGFMAESQLVTM
jgi:hypothetical protein